MLLYISETNTTAAPIRHPTTAILVFAKIREKANHKHSSYEVSIFVGSVELLAIGGVVPLGEDKPASCFLGSSVKPLLAVMSPSKTTISKDIYVKKQADRVIQSERLLRQYYKVHAGKSGPST